MTGILLDTNIVIDFLRKSEGAFQYITALASKPTISVVTVTELIAGVKTRREEERIGRLDELMHIRPVTLPIARRAGEYCRHFQTAHGFDDLDAILRQPPTIMSLLSRHST